MPKNWIWDGSIVGLFVIINEMLLEAGVKLKFVAKKTPDDKTSINLEQVQ